MNIQQIKDDRDRLQHSLNLLIAQIGPIQIGSVKQFPFGWRKAAKGRTVWRIIEEAITQNIEKHYRELSIDNVHISDSEVSVYDMSCTYAHNKPIYINIKSAVIGGKKKTKMTFPKPKVSSIFTNKILIEISLLPHSSSSLMLI
ncbi:hypothetical protein ACIW9X_02860 [Bacteroides fragilis]